MLRIWTAVAFLVSWFEEKGCHKLEIAHKKIKEKKKSSGCQPTAIYWLTKNNGLEFSVLLKAQ